MEKSLRILKMLAKIPRGKVTTYGALARVCKSSPRAVGQIMRRNAHPEIYPCYKCVSASGRIHGYSGQLKGSQVGKKIALLEADGIEIKNGKINLEKYQHKFM